MKEFVPVVLAGGEGATLIPLINNKPKCLLPVGNLPLIYFTLNYIEREGFKDVYVVTRINWKNDIDNELSKVGMRYERLALSLKIHYITFDYDNFTGTAKLFYLIKEYIDNVRSIIFFGGDFVGNLESLNELVALHRKNESILSVFLTNSTPLHLYEDKKETTSSKIKHSKDYQLLKCGQLYINSKDIILMDKDEEKLLYLLNENEIDDNIMFNPMLMLKYPQMYCSTSLHDLHIYIIRYDVIEEYTKNKWDTRVESLRVDIIPQIIAKQFQSIDPDDSTSSGYTTDEERSLLTNPLNHTDTTSSYGFHEVLDYINFGQTNSFKSINDSFYIQKNNKANCRKCSIYINRSPTPVFRVNTMNAYIRANRDIYETIMLIQKPLPPLKPGVRHKKIIPRKETYYKCCIDVSVTFADNCNIRHSNIGPNSVIKDESCINESTIFNNVTIGSSCSIENCIIASNSVIGDNCCLKNCIVGPGESISANSYYENEKIVGVIELLID